MKNTILSLTLVLSLAACAVEGNKSNNTINTVNPNITEYTEVETPSMENEVTLQLFDQETFDAQRQLWLEQGLRHYSFDIMILYEVGGRGQYSGTATVKDGALDSFVFVDTFKRDGTPYSYPDDLDYLFLRIGLVSRFIAPVSGIYDALIAVRDWVVESTEHDSKQEWRHPVRINYTLEAEYDNEYHFPKHLAYSSLAKPKDESLHLVGNGAGYTITITDFTIDP